MFLVQDVTSICFVGSRLKQTCSELDNTKPNHRISKRKFMAGGK